MYHTKTEGASGCDYVNIDRYLLHRPVYRYFYAEWSFRYGCLWVRFWVDLWVFMGVYMVGKVAIV
jgi:hypothetical protein